MARADLLIDIVRAAAQGDQTLYRKALEALISEERAKQHHILADRLAGYMANSDSIKPISGPTYRNGITNNLFYELIPNRKLDDLILSAIIKSTCEEIIEEHNRSDILRAYNIEPRNRILLAGPPGNGKTSLAEAIASELGVSFLVVRYESVIASYLGETAIRLSKLFDQIRTRQCVLFFDEFDVVGKERGDVHETGEIKRVVSSLLLQIDSLPSYVVVITATNHPELLDRAVWRRFQLRLELSTPTQQQIEEWFKKFESKIGQKLGIPIKTITKKLKGANFSELEQICIDIQRRYVLSIPNASIHKIINDRLKQWEYRFRLKNNTSEDINA